VGPILFHAGRRTDKHEEANCSFAQFLNGLEDGKERRVSIKSLKVHVLSFWKRNFILEGKEIITRPNTRYFMEDKVQYKNAQLDEVISKNFLIK